VLGAVNGAGANRSSVRVSGDVTTASVLEELHQRLGGGIQIACWALDSAALEVSSSGPSRQQAPVQRPVLLGALGRVLQEPGDVPGIGGHGGMFVARRRTDRGRRSPRPTHLVGPSRGRVAPPCASLFGRQQRLYFSRCRRGTGRFGPMPCELTLPGVAVTADHRRHPWSAATPGRLRGPGARQARTG